MSLGKLHIWVAILIFWLPVSLSGQTLGFLTGSGGLGDESFNDAVYRGMARAARESGHRLIYREWEQDRDMYGLFLELVEEKADRIVLNGDQFLPVVKKYASRFPKVKIIANDFEAGGAPNVKSIVYDHHEGAFLAGALSGWVTQSGKVGFIGAIDIDVVHSFLVGFREGVAFASPSCEVTVDFISRLPDYSGFNDPAGAAKIAGERYAGGVDVLFSVAGLSGNGVIRVAGMKRKYVIGVDRDQDHMARGFVLTSVIKQMDHAVYKELVKINNGAFEPGTVFYNLGNGGVALSPMKYTKHKIPSRILEKLEKVKQEIVGGKIRVTNSLKTGEPAP